MAQTQPTQPDYTKYQSITDILTKDPQKYIPGLEDAIVRAWSEHTKGVATDKNQGDGLADAIYGAAEKYVRDQFYGGEISNNARVKRLLEDEIQRTVGFTAEQLSGFYTGKKEVHLTEVVQFVEKAKEAIGEQLKTDYERSLRRLEEADFEPFRDYVLKLATEAGLTDITKDSMPRLSEVIKVYNEDVQPEYARYLQTKERRDAKAAVKKNKTAPKVSP